MPLDTAGLETTLTNLFKKSNSPEEAAKEVAKAIETFVKTATVSTNIAVGACVVSTPVAGTPTPGSNPALVPATGTIS